MMFLEVSVLSITFDCNCLAYSYNINFITFPEPFHTSICNVSGFCGYKLFLCLSERENKRQEKRKLKQKKKK